MFGNPAKSKTKQNNKTMEAKIAKKAMKFLKVKTKGEFILVFYEWHPLSASKCHSSECPILLNMDHVNRTTSAVSTCTLFFLGLGLGEIPIPTNLYRL